MSKTRQELMIEIAGDLGILPPNQTLSAEDSSTIDGMIDPAVATLASREIIYIPDAETIDDAVFLPLAVYIAAKVAPKYGTAIDASAAEYELRQLARPPSARRYLTTDPIYRRGTRRYR